MKYFKIVIPAVFIFLFSCKKEEKGVLNGKWYKQKSEVKLYIDNQLVKDTTILYPDQSEYFNFLTDTSGILYERSWEKETDFAYNKTDNYLNMGGRVEYESFSVHFRYRFLINELKASRLVLSEKNSSSPRGGGGGGRGENFPDEPQYRREAVTYFSR